MTFDPFGDFTSRGYLRNHGAEKDPQAIKAAEHRSFSAGINAALDNLASKQTLTYADVLKTHEILFRRVYPWAGMDRAGAGLQEARDSGDDGKRLLGEGIVKGPVHFMPGSRAETGTNFALGQGNNRDFMREKPGEVLGSLAYAHPFLDGNGRTIMTVHGELASRAGIHIDWSKTDKQEYLSALTKELSDPGNHLDAYLKPFVREGAMDRQNRVEGLTTLPGLSVPPLEAQPILTVVAGPQGAGKTLAIDQGHFGPLHVIDPNQIAKQLSRDSPQDPAFEAGRRALDERAKMFQFKTSFAVEATLAGSSTLKLMNEARANGFKVDLKFIGVESAEIANERIGARSAIDYQQPSAKDVSRRFNATMDNLPEAMTKADTVQLLDNSGDQPREVARGNDKELTFSNPKPWAVDAAIERASNDMAKSTDLAEKAQHADRVTHAAEAGGETHQEVAKASAEYRTQIDKALSADRSSLPGTRNTQQRAERQQRGPGDDSYGR